MSQSQIEIRTDINPKDFFPDAKHIVLYAFSIKDIHYFLFDDASKQAEQLSVGIDYEKLAKAITNEMKGLILAQTQNHKNSDSDSASSYLEKRNQRTEYIRKRYSSQ